MSKMCLSFTCIGLCIVMMHWHKIHWVSKENYHFFRAMLTKIHPIKIRNIWTQTSHSTPYEAHLKNQRTAFVRKEKNAVKSQIAHWEVRTSTKGHLFNSEPPRKATFQFRTSMATYSIQNIISNYIFFTKCNRRTCFCPCQTPCPGGEQFLWFLENDLLRFHCSLLLFYSRKHLFFEMCLVRSSIANFYPIMGNFNPLKTSHEYTRAGVYGKCML